MQKIKAQEQPKNTISFHPEYNFGHLESGLILYLQNLIIF